MNAQAHEIDQLRAANVMLTNALETAVITIERLDIKHGSFASTIGTLALAKAVLKNNKG